MEPKRTKQFDAWETNGIETLQDLFDFESQQLDKINKKKIQIATAASAAQKDLYKQELDELLKGYEEVITKVRKSAEETIDEQHNLRLASYQDEYEEYAAFLKKQGQLSDKQQQKQLKALAKAQKIEEQNFNSKKKREGKQALIDAKAAKKRDRESILSESKHALGGVGSVGQQMVASFSKVAENLGKSIGKAFNDISNKINGMMDTYSKYQSTIDTRLQGSNKNFTEMQAFLKKQVGASPYLKTETMLNNLQSLVEAGVVTNVEQRAFLNTIKDKIAGTFDASNAALLRIIRLQQRDSTAARLGMEAFLTDFLNKTVENTEYLTSTFDNVQEALLEASSIMTTAASTEFEYVVQKWLGTLVGRGLSDTTATGLASALGMLASGNVSGLSGNALNNLLVMAASRAGLDYGDLLTGGLNKTNTNDLMKALVLYMQEINSSGNNVVRSQYAQTFGLSISDLMAATGLGSSLTDVYTSMLDYSGMYKELGNQLNQVSSRTHISEKLGNLFENAQFSLASTIAGNAVMSAMWKVTDMIQGVTGGINIPAISAMGSGIDLETTVENLMKLGLVGVGSLRMINDVITGLSKSGGNFSNVLKGLGISFSDAAYKYAFDFTTQSTGRGAARRSRGLTTSLTTSLLTSTSNTEDMKEQTLNAAMDDSKKEQAAAMEEMDNPTADLRTYFLDVFDVKFSNLLAMVAHGGGYSMYSPLEEQTMTIGDRSVIKTTYSVSTDNSHMNNIENYVSSIYSLLSNGTISVKVVDYGLASGGNSTLG